MQSSIPLSSENYFYKRQNEKETQRLLKYNLAKKGAEFNLLKAKQLPKGKIIFTAF